MSRVELPYRDGNNVIGTPPAPSDQPGDGVGHWTLVPFHSSLEQDENARAIYVTCPQCGNESYCRAHSVDADGTSNPSYVCPYPPCTWHVFVKLLEWRERTGGAIKQPNEYVKLILSLFICLLLSTPCHAADLLYPIKHPIASAKYLGEKAKHPIETSKAVGVGIYHGCCKIGEWNEQSHFGSFMGLGAAGAQMWYGFSRL